MIRKQGCIIHHARSPAATSGDIPLWQTVAVPIPYGKDLTGTPSERAGMTTSAGAYRHIRISSPPIIPIFETGQDGVQRTIAVQIPQRQRVIVHQQFPVRREISSPVVEQDTVHLIGDQKSILMSSPFRSARKHGQYAFCSSSSNAGSNLWTIRPPPQPSRHRQTSQTAKRGTFARF
jgi:hypothetical protein